MRILLANVQLSGRSGTELYVFDLAIEFTRLGHLPTVYSPHLGPLAAELRERAVPVVDDLRHIAERPDVIHGNHNLPTLTALLAFPETPAVHVCHDCSAWHDRPVRHPRILRHLAVDAACRERLLQMEGVPEQQIEIHQNGVDLKSFVRRDALPPAPRSALLLSNYADDRTLRVLRHALEPQGVRLTAAGRKLGGASSTPARLFGCHDLVFAKGRTAWEAMASGAAVVVCDHASVGELVRRDNVDRLRLWNFGRRTLQTPLSVAAVQRQLALYDAADAGAVCDAIRRCSSLETAALRLLELYEVILEEHASAPSSSYVESMAAAETLAWFAKHQRELATELAQRRTLAGTLARWTRSAHRKWNLRRLTSPPSSHRAA
ncbi:MAG: glycosyltransferase [Planctomycetales bacterium]|nr:glycosyltransferase [Planctomycetales bacterium]